MCSFSTFCGVFFLLLQRLLERRALSVAAGQLFRAFFSLFFSFLAILAGIERHSVGICSTFLISTRQTAKDTGSGLPVQTVLCM